MQRMLLSSPPRARARLELKPHPHSVPSPPLVLHVSSQDHSLTGPGAPISVSGSVSWDPNPRSQGRDPGRKIRCLKKNPTKLDIWPDISNPNASLWFCLQPSEAQCGPRAVYFPTSSGQSEEPRRAGHGWCHRSAPSLRRRLVRPKARLVMLRARSSQAPPASGGLAWPAGHTTPKLLHPTAPPGI